MDRNELDRARIASHPHWTERELEAIAKLSGDKEMTPAQVVRQALRLYQMEHDGVVEVIRPYQEPQPPDDLPHYTGCDCSWCKVHGNHALTRDYWIYTTRCECCGKNNDYCVDKSSMNHATFRRVTLSRERQSFQPCERCGRATLQTLVALDNEPATTEPV